MRTDEALNSFLNSRLAANLSPLTIEWYRNKLERFAAIYQELPEAPEPIEVFLAGVKGCPETKHAYFRALRAFYHFIRERRSISNPMAKVAPPRCPRKVMSTLGPYEAMRLLSVASDLRARAVLSLLIDNGLRSGEIVGLRKQDIRTETVRVYGKSGQREVPISEETRKLLLALIAQDGSSNHVFVGRKGPLTRHGIYQIVRAHMRKADIDGPKLGGHRIRHAFGKGYLVNGGDLRSLQELMGHADISTTQKYASLNLSDIIAKHRQFTPLRSAHAAAQAELFKAEAVEEAAAILAARQEGRSGGNT